MAVKPTKLAVLPEEWILPFVASWRVFERTLNDSFSFIMVCNVCGKEGAEHIEFVQSKKSEETIIGMQCECGNTLKFETPSSPNDEDFPQRLATRGTSVLVRTGAKPRVDKKLLAVVTDLVFK